MTGGSGGHYWSVLVNININITQHCELLHLTWPGSLGGQGRVGEAFIDLDLISN